MARSLGRPNREQALRQLVALHRQATRPPRSEDLPRELQIALRVYFGSIAKARRAAGVPPPPLRRRWSVDGVLGELRRASRRGVVATVRGLIEAGHNDLMSAIYVYIGSLVRARVMARVPHPRRRHVEREPWDEDRILGEILDRRDKGKPIAFSKVEPALVAAAGRHFGSWRAAIEAAGLDYNQVRLSRPAYTREELLDLLQDLAARKPRMTLADVHRLKWCNALRARFGSVEAAATAAGVRGWPKRLVHRLMPRKHVIARLRARHRAGKPVYSNAIAKEDPRLWRSAMFHYAAWARVLAAARLPNDSPKQRTWSRQLVIARLRERQRRGLPLRPTDVQRDDGSLYAQAVKYFGSYREAARRLGVETSKRHWTRAMVVRELRRVARGRTWLTAARTPPALLGAARTVFGTFSAACGAIGLEVHTKRNWTRADVIRELRRLARSGPVQRRRAVGGLDKACVRFFGSFVAARDAALARTG